MLLFILFTVDCVLICAGEFACIVVVSTCCVNRLVTYCVIVWIYCKLRNSVGLFVVVIAGLLGLLSWLIGLWLVVILVLTYLVVVDCYVLVVWFIIMSGLVLCLLFI